MTLFLDNHGFTERNSNYLNIDLFLVAWRRVVNYYIIDTGVKAAYVDNTAEHQTTQRIQGSRSK